MQDITFDLMINPSPFLSFSARSRGEAYPPEEPGVRGFAHLQRSAQSNRQPGRSTEICQLPQEKGLFLNVPCHASLLVLFM
jgi:hypothetical protein